MIILPHAVGPDTATVMMLPSQRVFLCPRDDEHGHQSKDSDVQVAAALEIGRHRITFPHLRDELVPHLVGELVQFVEGLDGRDDVEVVPRETARLLRRGEGDLDLLLVPGFRRGLERLGDLGSVLDLPLRLLLGRELLRFDDGLGDGDGRRRRRRGRGRRRVGGERVRFRS